jgi:HEAT repeat protein
LKDGNGPGYTEALAQVVPKLSGAAQESAREALTARLASMPATALRDRLRDEDEEIRRAAIRACGRTKDKSLVPDLIPLVSDGDEVIAPLASRSLKSLTAQEIGPSGKAPPVQWASAALAWEYWWKKQTEQK